MTRRRDRGVEQATLASLDLRHEAARPWRATSRPGEASDQVAPDGDTWHFRWTFNGQTVATSRVSVDDLAAADHLLVVPDDVTSKLRRAQPTPTP